MKNLLTVLIASIFPMSASADDPELRKQRSIELLVERDIPFIEHLPLIEHVHETTRRTEEEVVQRTIALVIVAVKGETGDDALTHKIIEQFDAEGFFTPDEQAFLDDPNPTETDRKKFTWRYEGVQVLLWSLQIFGDLSWPDQIADVPKIAETLKEMGTEGLRANAKLRSQAELLDRADLIYRCNWAAVEARLNGKPALAGLEGGVVQERHHTLNWLIGYMDQTWDDVSTDT